MSLEALILSEIVGVLTRLATGSRRVRKGEIVLTVEGVEAHFLGVVYDHAGKKVMVGVSLPNGREHWYEITGPYSARKAAIQMAAEIRKTNSK